MRLEINEQNSIHQRMNNYNNNKNNKRILPLFPRFGLQEGIEQFSNPTGGKHLNGP
jgi:hypothetical protein